jgi:pyrroloquinoline quinone biosynthesis protein D
MATTGCVSHGVLELTLPSEASQPRLAPGCRWSMQGEQRVVLFPEGMIRVEGSGLNILELCDGQNSVQQIVANLAERYEKADSEKIMQDVSTFLEALHRKRIVDY